MKSSLSPRLLSYADIAEMIGKHPKTVARYASRQRPLAKRLRVVRLSRKTVMVRPSDWEMFVEANAAAKGF